MDNKIVFENMEILRSKFKISYKEAKEVLDLNDNDLIKSLIYLEDIKGVLSEEKCCFHKSLNIIKNKVFSLYDEGQNQRVIISRKGNLIADIPLTAVVVSSFAFILYPILLPIKLGGILLMDIDFQVVNKQSGDVYDVNSDIKEKVNNVFNISKEKINDVISTTDIKSKTEDIKNRAFEFSIKAKENINEIIENKISKKAKDKSVSYAKFVYNSEDEKVDEIYNSEDDIVENN